MFTLQIERAENSLEALKRVERAQIRKTSMRKAEKKLAKSLMARIFTVSIYYDTETTASVGTFDAKEVKKAVDGRVRGLYLTFAPTATIQPSLKALLVAIPNTTSYYLPYRSISSPFTMTVPAGKGSYISATYQVGTAFKGIRIEFEYDVDWETITSPELNLLLGWLNALRVDRISVVSQLKATALQYANGFIANKNGYDAALKGATGLDAQITAANTQITTLQADITKNDQTIATLNTQIATKEQNLAALKQKQSDANGKVSQGDQSIAAQSETLKTLGAQKTAGITDTSTFQNGMNNNKDSFAGLLATIKEEYAADYSILENARKAVFDINPPDLKKCNDLLNQATPYF